MKQPDSIDIGTQMDIAKYRLQTAKEDLDTAELTYKAEQFRAANNRAYYSIFYSICAVLAKEGVSFKRYKDTIGYFNKNYTTLQVFYKKISYRNFLMYNKFTTTITKESNLYDKLIIQQQKPNW